MVRLPISLAAHKGLFLAASLLLGAAGCGEEQPPYDALPLRDALRAAPEVMATLPEDSRREIASRLEEAERAEDDPTAFPRPEVGTLDNLVSSADALREEVGKDALLFGELSMNEGGGLLEPRAEQAETDSAPAGEGPLEVRGKPSASTAALEEAALKGRAGRALRGLVDRTQAKSIVRMTGLPVGAVAWEETVYVNASWLVALSALEEGAAAVPAPAVDLPGGAIETPKPKALSVEFNPFKLPGTLLECSTQVQTTCQCAKTGSCTHIPTDPTFANANDECTWVNQSALNPGALCVLALMSIDGVRQCVQSVSSACAAVPNRDVAISFMNDEQCKTFLDACLEDGEPVSSRDPSGCNDCTKCDGCEDCKYCDGKGNDAQECASDCDDWAKLCAACAEICAACSSNADPKNTDSSTPFTYATVGATTQCSARPRVGKSLLPAPFGTALWLFAPVAYLLSRSKRRRP